MYRFQKFVRRNKAKVIASGLLLSALLAGMAGTSWQWYRAEKSLVEEERQRTAAEANEKLAEERLVQVDAEKKRVEAEKKRVEAEKKRAEEEKQVAQAVKDFLQNKLLAQSDATAQADALLQAGELAAEAKLNPTIRELLDRAAMELAPDKIEKNFPNQPLVQAEILRTVGDAYRGAGDASTAIPFLTRAVELFKAKLGPRSPRDPTPLSVLGEQM